MDFGWRRTRTIWLGLSNKSWWEGDTQLYSLLASSKSKRSCFFTDLISSCSAIFTTELFYFYFAALWDVLIKIIKIEQHTRYYNCYFLINLKIWNLFQVAKIPELKLRRSNQGLFSNWRVGLFLSDPRKLNTYQRILVIRNFYLVECFKI